MDLNEMKLQNFSKEIVIVNRFCELMGEGRLYQ